MHVISQGKQFWTCGLRHCKDFEKLFILLMNFNWIEKMQHGLVKKNIMIKFIIQEQSPSFDVQSFFSQDPLND